DPLESNAFQELQERSLIENYLQRNNEEGNLQIVRKEGMDYAHRLPMILRKIRVTLSQLLRCFVGKSLRSSEEWLHHIEFAYNRVVSTTTSHSPFELAYGPKSREHLGQVEVESMSAPKEHLGPSRLQCQKSLHKERRIRKYVIQCGISAKSRPSTVNSCRHEASIRCLSRLRRYRTRIWEAGSYRRPTSDDPPPKPPTELKPLPDHLKYAYLGDEQQFSVIIASNLHQEQEEKLLQVLKQHKKAIGWKLSDLPRINPSICMHKILMEEEARSLLTVGIIYPISDNSWVSPVQVVPKKSRMTMMKNCNDELVPTRVQNNRRDHFPQPFLDQVLEKLAGKSHYCFLDGYFGYMQIHIAPKDQHKITFTCPFGTFAYTRMSFGLCNAPSTFQRCMLSIFSYLLEDCMEVFIDDFTVYADTFNACLRNMARGLK
ncbi:Retrovirus-related Pol polyprotein from transposon 17.6, partial [Mucuna pruriens]